MIELSKLQLYYSFLLYYIIVLSPGCNQFTAEGDCRIEFTPNAIPVPAGGRAVIKCKTMTLAIYCNVENRWINIATRTRFPKGKDIFSDYNK